VWYSTKIWTKLSSVLSQFTRLTDGRTDSFLIAIPRLHSVQRSKNQTFKIDQKRVCLISSQLSHVDECFVFNLLLKLLTVCGEKEVVVFIDDHFIVFIMILNDMALVEICLINFCCYTF